MDIGDWYSSRFLNDTYRRIRELGLETNIAEIEAFGFTMIENALTAEEVARTQAAILRVAERRLGYPIDLDSTVNLKGKVPGTPVITGLLFEDEWFENLLMRSAPLLIITYLMGQSVKLNSVSSHIKAGGADGLKLHVDADNGITTPLPFYSTFANLTYTLTDYSLEGGALAMVPGSHRWCRQPSPIESVMYRALERAASEVYPGSTALPSMLTGGTDMAHLRAKGMQSYGIGPASTEADALNYPAHGDVERLAESSLYPFVQYVWTVVNEVAAHK